MIKLSVRTERAIKKILEVEKRNDGAKWHAERKANSVEIAIFDAAIGREVIAKITLRALIKKRGAKRKKRL